MKTSQSNPRVQNGEVIINDNQQQVDLIISSDSPSSSNDNPQKNALQPNNDLRDAYFIDADQNYGDIQEIQNRSPSISRLINLNQGQYRSSTSTVFHQSERETPSNPTQQIKLDTGASSELCDEVPPIIDRSAEQIGYERHKLDSSLNQNKNSNRRELLKQNLKQHLDISKNSNDFAKLGDETSQGGKFNLISKLKRDNTHALNQEVSLPGSSKRSSVSSTMNNLAFDQHNQISSGNLTNKNSEQNNLDESGEVEQLS